MFSPFIPHGRGLSLDYDNCQSCYVEAYFAGFGIGKFDQLMYSHFSHLIVWSSGYRQE